MASSGVSVQTICVIQNNTGLDATLIGFKNWAGDGQPPQKIADRGSGHFNQTQLPGNTDGSIGGVVYQGLLGYQWVFAWSNKSVVNNQAYTTILKPSEKYNWDDIKKKLSQSGNVGSDTASTYSSNVVIDATGDSPSFTAQLKA